MTIPEVFRFQPLALSLCRQVFCLELMTSSSASPPAPSSVLSHVTDIHFSVFIYSSLFVAVLRQGLMKSAGLEFVR